MNDIVWQDPPAGTGSTGRRKWAPLIAACKERPGKWALVGDFSSASSTDAFRKLGVETTTRRRDDGRVDLYVRWPEAS